MLSTNKIVLPSKLFLPPFSGLFVCPSFLPPPNPQPFLVEALSFFTCSPFPLPVQSAAHLGNSCICHLPASVARTCSLLRVPVSAAFYRYGAVPSLSLSAYNQVPIRPWGVACRRSLCASVCLPRPP